MARIVGGSFKQGAQGRSQKQETAMDRALASFVSPDGVRLLAQGVGALGKLPWQSKEGGLGLMKEAAKKRNAEAQAVLQQAANLNKEAKRGFTDREVQLQRDALSPYEDEEMADPTSTYGNAKMGEMLRAAGQREGETPDAYKVRVTDENVIGQQTFRSKGDAQEERRLKAALEMDIGKPEDREVTVTGARMEAMIKQAQESGRDVDDLNLGMISEKELRKSLENKLAFAFKDAEASVDDLQALSNEDLMDQAVNAQSANRDLRKTTRAIQDMFGQQVDPLMVQQLVEKSVRSRRDYNQRVRGELRRRSSVIQESSPTEFIEGRIAKQLAGLDPVEQRAELRRLAKSVKNQEDKDEVMSLASRFKPVRSNVADYFTSDDDLRTEFEDELGKLLPNIDPLGGLKRQKLEGEVAVLGATASEIGERNSTKLAIALAEGDVAKAAALGKTADKAATRGREARAKEDSKLAGIARSLARSIKFPTENAAFQKDAGDILNRSGSYLSKYRALHALTAGIVQKALLAQEISDLDQVDRAMPKSTTQNKPN